MAKKAEKKAGSGDAKKGGAEKKAKPTTSADADAGGSGKVHIHSHYMSNVDTTLREVEGCHCG
jgi:hypothetical protein